MSAPPPDEDRVARARQLFESGMSLRDVGRDPAVDVSRETVRRWARAGDWQAPLVAPGADGTPKVVPTTEEIEQARLRAEKARQEARARWSVRRSEEADAVGLSAAAVRQKILEYVTQNKPAEARQLATVYGIFVDKANLLSGDAVPRGRQGDEIDPATVGPRPTDPAEMAAAGARRALALVPSIDVDSRTVEG